MVRTQPFLFGVALIGLGSTAALAAQTGLSLAQSASISILVCSTVILVFLIVVSRFRRAVRANIQRSA